MSRTREGHPAWRRIVAVYIAVQFAEIFGVSMIYSYLPLALEGTGVPIGDIASLTGIAIAGLFVIGAPQVPIWLAIAELRSRRLVIVRSGLIALAALKSEMTRARSLAGATSRIVASMTPVLPSQKPSATVAATSCHA